MKVNFYSKLFLFQNISNNQNISTVQQQLGITMFQTKNQQSSESFYSIYSHESVFEGYSPMKNKDSHQYEQRQKIILDDLNNEKQFSKKSVQSNVAQPKVINIAQSSFNLDQGVLDIEQNTSLNSKKSYETMRNIWKKQQQQPKKQFKKTPSIPQEHQRMLLQPHDISQIKPNQVNEALQHSLHLMNEIDCLSTERVSHQQLREIKKKINYLKTEQSSLQGSLNVANQMLKNAKTRNQILEMQLDKYKKQQEIKQINNQKALFDQLKKREISGNNIAQQRRYFPQHSQTQNNQTLNRLKILYKECSIKQSFCIYQNQGYKIQVFYINQKQIGQQVQLVVNVKLTPHHHIVSRKQFKFGMQFQKKQQINLSQLSIQGVSKFKRFKTWPQSKFHIQTIIHQYDSESNKHHTHSILVPLPITHFFEPRFILVDDNTVKKLKSVCSQYIISLSGSISVNWMQKMKEMWWMGKFLSVIGWKQTFMFDVNLQNSNQSIKIEVFGKKNSKIMTGVIEYISFLLTN